MTETAKDQTSFRREYKFASKCVHCGKPMSYMSVETYESTGPGRIEERDVFVMWIDPTHDCDHLKIEPKKQEALA